MSGRSVPRRSQRAVRAAGAAALLGTTALGASGSAHADLAPVPSPTVDLVLAQAPDPGGTPSPSGVAVAPVASPPPPAEGRPPVSAPGPVAPVPTTREYPSAAAVGAAGGASAADGASDLATPPAPPPPPPPAAPRAVPPATAVPASPAAAASTPPTTPAPPPSVQVPAVAASDDPPTSDAPAGTATLQQTRAVAGRSGASALLRWTAARPLTGQVRVALPPGWTPPSVTGVTGALVRVGGTCAVRVPPLVDGRTVTTSVVCPTAGTLLLGYSGATAPPQAGDHALAVHTRPDGAADWTPQTAPPTLRVVPAGLATLTFVAQPSGGRAGETLPQEPVLVGVDDHGNPARGTIRLGLRGDDGGLEGELVRPLVDGRVAFPGLRLRSAGHEQRLVAVAGPVVQVSDPFLVTGSEPAAVSFRTPPLTTRSGEPLRPAPVLQVRDAQGHGVPTRVPVTVRLLDGPPGAALSGATTVVTDGGRAVLPDLVVHGPAGRVLLVAEAQGLTRSAPLPVEVRAGAAVPAHAPRGQLTAPPTGDGAEPLAGTAVPPTLVPPPQAGTAVPPTLVPPLLPFLAPPAGLAPVVAPSAELPLLAAADVPGLPRTPGALDQRAWSASAHTRSVGALWLALLATGTALLLRSRLLRPRRSGRRAG